MPAKRKYQPQHSAETPVLPGSLPLDRAVAVYYRQSSMAQVGNISTEMQQIDLPKYVNSLGWNTDEIILIDEDEGVSGAKRIDERKGMSRLFDLIITGKIGVVAVQAEDRLFRDETQIQVNVFIDACVKNNVRVITPYFKYNFSDKHEGPYHRLLFRMRAEQAADFLNSYVRGRLLAAKERMLMQGMWMGGSIHLGFMIDDRKYITTGVPNPNWRKYQLFEPCASVIVKIFEIFLMLGGNQRATLRYIFEHGPHFPDFDDPELYKLVPPGFIFAKPMRMLKRGSIYMPGAITLENMLTHAVYIGHWTYKNRIVVWNNHPAIVPENLFFRAFNYLSPYDLDGSPNPDYAPRLGYTHSTKKVRRTVVEPIYIGLVGSYHNGKWRNATASWEKGIQTYAYTCNYTDLADNQHLLWSRRGDFFDKIITEMLHEKLDATFDPQIWESVLASAGDDFEAEHRRLSHQLSSVEQKMQALLGNFAMVQSQTLLRALEREYANHEQEKERLERKLADLKRRISRQDQLRELAKQAKTVLANWHRLGLMERRAVAQTFITRIVVTQTGKYRVANVNIHWRDNSIDHIVLPYSAATWALWLPEEVENLTKLIDQHASQIEMAEALPNRNWRAIRIKAYEIVGKRSFQISPKPIREDETYQQYFERVAKTDGKLPYNRSRWIQEEVEMLEKLLDAGATQLEIAAALPHRSWEKIRMRITKLRGKKFKVQDTGYLQPNETVHDYIAQNPTAAIAMNLSISKNLSPH
jgi:DNA invertase Pin-like site-specific DNA recombinase